jgi:hypothetical protein
MAVARLGEVGTTRSIQRALLPVSAVSFGSLGWSVAHLVTSSLLAHRHDPAHGTPAGVAHVHAADVALLIVATALTATSLLAVICAASFSRGRVAAPAVGLASTARRAGVWSTAAFVAAESAGYAVSDTHVVPPPLMLLAGLAAHALAGAVAAVLWRRSVDGVLLAAALGHGRALPGATAQANTFTRPVPGRSAWLLLGLAGRAPPVLGVTA